MGERACVLVFFDEVPDPRVERTRRHKLSDILLIVLIGTICKCKGWDALHQFAEDSDEYLESLLELPHGVPSADTSRSSRRRLAHTLRAVVAGCAPSYSSSERNVSRGDLVRTTRLRLQPRCLRDTPLGAMPNHWRIENRLRWVLRRHLRRGPRARAPQTAPEGRGAVRRSPSTSSGAPP